MRRYRHLIGQLVAPDNGLRVHCISVLYSLHGAERGSSSPHRSPASFSGLFSSAQPCWISHGSSCCLSRSPSLPKTCCADRRISESTRPRPNSTPQISITYSNGLKHLKRPISESTSQVPYCANLAPRLLLSLIQLRPVLNTHRFGHWIIRVC